MTFSIIMFALSFVAFVGLLAQTTETKRGYKAELSMRNRHGQTVQNTRSVTNLQGYIRKQVSSIGVELVTLKRGANVSSLRIELADGTTYRERVRTDAFDAVLDKVKSWRNIQDAPLRFGSHRGTVSDLSAD